MNKVSADQAELLVNVVFQDQTVDLELQVHEAQQDYKVNAVPQVEWVLLGHLEEKVYLDQWDLRGNKDNLACQAQQGQ